MSLLETGAFSAVKVDKEKIQYEPGLLRMRKLKGKSRLKVLHSENEKQIV